jgi:hypothetical protein
MSFHVVPPTEENQKLVEKYVYLGRSHIKPEFLAALCENPLSRIGVAWHNLERSGLSPFLYSAISRQEPRKVLEQYAEEWPSGVWQLCSTVMLPVGYVDTNWTASGYGTRPYKTVRKEALLDFSIYDEEILEQEEIVNQDIEDYRRDPWGEKPYLPSGRNAYSTRTMEKLLKRFGGKTWKRHCKRTFNPFKKETSGGGVDLQEWKILKQAYWLKEFKK